MNNKIPVQLRPPRHTKYVYEKLRICKHCLRYTILYDEECPTCGKSGGLISLHSKAAAQVQRSTRNDRLIALLITLVSIFFGRTFQEMALALVAGLLLTGMLIYVQHRTKPQAISRELNRIFIRDRQQIINGLIANLDWAAAIGKENKALSYEMMREIATLVHDDSIRSLQIMLLQSFVLRKDMDLELEPLLQKRFDPDLVEYIGELSKIKRELIKDKTFRYILKYEQHIASMSRGDEILSGVAAAAVRQKRYCLTYAEFIARYARLFPKERFLRLYRVVNGSPQDDWGALGEEVARIFTEKYQWDADFQQPAIRSNSL